MGERLNYMTMKTRCRTSNLCKRGAYKAQQFCNDPFSCYYIVEYSEMEGVLCVQTKTFIIGNNNRRTIKQIIKPHNCFYFGNRGLLNRARQYLYELRSAQHPPPHNPHTHDHGHSSMERTQSIFLSAAKGLNELLLFICVPYMLQCRASVLQVPKSTEYVRPFYLCYIHCDWFISFSRGWVALRSGPRPSRTQRDLSQLCAGTCAMPFHLFSIVHLLQIMHKITFNVCITTISIHQQGALIPQFRSANCHRQIHQKCFFADWDNVDIIKIVRRVHTQRHGRARAHAALWRFTHHNSSGYILMCLHKTVNHTIMHCIVFHTVTTQHTYAHPPTAVMLLVTHIHILCLLSNGEWGAGTCFFWIKIQRCRLRPFKFQLMCRCYAPLYPLTPHS